MDVIFVYEREGLPDVATQVKNKIVDMLETAFNLNNPSKTENLILPIVPRIKFPNQAKIDHYEGLTSDYNIPSRRNLDEIEWESFFPVNKSYPFQRVGSAVNGYDYAKFLQRRLENQLPFRLIAYEKNTVFGATVGAVTDTVRNGVSVQALTNAIEVIFDGIVIVDTFDMATDNVGDIEYSLKLKQFTDTNNPLMDWYSYATTLATNTVAMTTNRALKNAGLI